MPAPNFSLLPRFSLSGQVQSDNISKPTFTNVQDMEPKRFIAYFRVSTERQGRSGLGLEAQQRAVADFLRNGDHQLVESFTEVESGRRCDRPQLALAKAACRKHRATLVIAKLDRLARSVAFVSSLMEGGIDFVAADMPQADRFMLHVYAAMAEEEARKISARTREALISAKARGVALGNPRNLDQARVASLGRRQEQARLFARNTLPIIRQVQAAGVTSWTGIAEALNRRGISAPRGGQWHPASVRALATKEGVGSESCWPRL